MSKSKFPMWIPVVVVLGAVGILGMVTLFNVISIKNQDVELTNKFDAQIDVNKVIYDEVTKVIFGMAQVAQTERASFGEIYSNLIGQRASGTENAMMAWVKEQNPQMSNELYAKVSTAIETQRAKFTRAQTKLISYKQEHDNLRERFPSSIVMGWIGAEELEIKLVLSTRVEEAFETGVDDNADPFAN
jgi:hypothetical protein